MALTRRDVLRALLGTPLVVAAASQAVQLPGTGIRLRPGWQFFECDGHRLFPRYSASGCLTSEVLAYAYDPRDRQLQVDGSFENAIKRGTAREFRFTPQHDGSLREWKRALFGEAA